MALELFPFDPSAHIETLEDARCYLEAAIEGSDARHIADALRDVARSKGMEDIATRTDLEARSLQQVLSAGDAVPLAAIISVLQALELELTVRKAGRMDEPRYHINLFWSDDDACWIADVPDLTPCSAHGDTRARALANIEDAIAAWLQAASEKGLPIPAPRHPPAAYAAA